MAPLLVQQKAITSKGLGSAGSDYLSTLTLSPVSSVAAGSFLLLFIPMTSAVLVDATVSTVTDNRGNTWSKYTGAQNITGDTDPDTNLAVEVWTATNATAGTLTITMTAGGSVAWTPIFQEWSGMAASPRGSTGTLLDPSYTTARTISTTASVTSGDVVVAGLATSLGTASYSAGNGFANLITSPVPPATGPQYLSAALESRVASATGVQSAGISTLATQYTKGVSFIVGLKQAITAVPSPPTDLSAVGGDQSASLSWSTANTASSYSVYRSLSSNGTFTLVQSGITATTFVQSGLTNGTTYYYKVSATNTVGESGQTAFAGVTPAVPAPVVFLDWYANGVQPNHTGAYMRLGFRNKVMQWFGYVLTGELVAGTPIPQYGRLPGPVKRIKAPDQAFYSPWDPNWQNKRNGTVSEGQGYGTLFCAWLSNPQLPSGTYWPDAKATAEALIRFYMANVNDKGLMNWHIYDTGVPGDYNGATDGDLDMAEALRVLSEIHGDAGPINFGAEAEKLMAAIQDYEFVPETGYAYPNLMLNGDNWGINYDSYMPDYFRVGYLREWAKWLRRRGNTARADRWLRIIDVNHAHNQYYVDSTTYTAGVPDRQTRTYGTIDGDFNNQITYNSVRLGFGYMLEYLWNGSSADPRAKQFMDKIANRAKAVFTTGGNIKAPNYSPNLSSSQGYSNLTGYGYIGSTTLGLTVNKTFATESFDALLASNEYATSYFNGGIGCYALGVMSGAAQPFTREATTPPPDPGGGGTPAPGPNVREATLQIYDGTKLVGIKALVPV